MASVDGVSPQVRRIAILVTSLDSAAGRQLLLAMPSGLARDVRKAMASLTSIDPEEQRQVLAEFRNQAISRTTSDAPPTRRATLPTPRSTAMAGGESAHAYLDSATEASLSDAANRGSHVDNSDTAIDEARPWAQLDVASLTDLLRGERPLVIAVVISQLQPRQAARLLEQFPREQHRAVIAHLTSLGDTDPEAMRAIDEHLASRIADYHHRCDNQNESIGRMQEFLAAASPELRSHWQEVIADSDHQLAKRLGIESTIKNVAGQDEDAAQASLTSAAGVNMAAWSGLVDMHSPSHSDVTTDHGPVVLPFPTPAQTASSLVASAEAVGPSAEESSARDSIPAITALDQILDLPPRTIARVLSAADGEVVLLALAGATPSFMQRFTAMLEKPDARALQSRLSALGAINLQDIDEAQRRLCELASYIVGQMRTRRPDASSTRVAA